MKWPAAKFRDQVVVVTGASAGLGRAIAVAFGSQGARVALIARPSDRLDDAAAAVREAGGEALAVPVDVADGEAVEHAAGRIEAELGLIDVWVNNAMVSVFAPVHRTTPDEFRRVTEVTYLGVVNGTLAALHRMRARDKGTIVQVGSALAYQGIPLQAAYCGAKHAIQGFCESLRAELAHDGSRVHVTMVQMPALNTPQFDWSRSRMPFKARPVPPVYAPEVGARAVVFAAGARRREVWVGWPTLRAIAGARFAPAIAEAYLARNGYDSQQTDQPEDPSRPDNLYAPVSGPYGMHGRFSDEATHRSPQQALSRHRGWLVTAGVALATAAAVVSLWPERVTGPKRRRPMTTRRHAA
ncbi:MAG: SDR family oxidoreductase [Vicinamibacterales bacterium]